MRFVVLLIGTFMLGGCQRAGEADLNLKPNATNPPPSPKLVTRETNKTVTQIEMVKPTPEKFIGRFFLRLDDHSYRCVRDGSDCAARKAAKPPARLIEGVLWSGYGEALWLDDARLVEVLDTGTPYIPSSIRENVRLLSEGCALNDSNELWCLGAPALCEPGFERQPLVFGQHRWCRSQFPEGKQVKQIVGWIGKGCALTHEGQLLCWPAPQGRTKPVEVNLGKQRQAKSVAVGSGHICVLTTDGEVGCWGGASKGQLGYMGEGPYHDSGYHGPPVNSFYRRTPPTHFLTFDSPAKEVYASSKMSCALLENGELWCWGDTGKLKFQSGEAQAWMDRMILRRNDRNQPVFKPVFESTLPDAPLELPKDCDPRDVSISGGSVCVICENDCVKCWGYLFRPDANAETWADQWGPPDQCIDFSSK